MVVSSFCIYMSTSTLFLTSDLKLAELKSIFDRFGIEGGMTPVEACQALAEAGIVVPRRLVVVV